MQAPLRVLQVFGTLGMGGAETWLMEALRLWSRSGEVQVDFLLTSGARGIFDDEALQLGSALHYIPYTRRSLPTFARGFRRILRDGRYDAIHDHQDYSAGWHFAMGGRSLPRIRVVHAHNPSYGIALLHGNTFARRSSATVGRRLIARYATHITGTSRQLLAEWGFESPQFRHIPRAALYCGIDTTRFVGDPLKAKQALCAEFGWPSSAKIIVVAGRMDESPDLGHAWNHKNTGFAVDVILASMRRDPEIRAIVAGRPSPALPVLQERTAAAGFEGRIAFTGVRTDIERIMLGSDLFLFPSRAEGLGMVSVEAQAAGLPVLASQDVPRESVVIPEAVRFLEIGLGADAWAEHLVRMVRADRDPAAANHRVAASPFSIDRSAAYLANLYRSGMLPDAPDAR